MEHCGNFLTRTDVHALSERFIIIDSAIYEISDFSSYKFSSNIPYIPRSAKIHDSQIAFSTEDALITWDIAKSASCGDEAHSHLESQEIILKGIGGILVLDNSSDHILLSSGLQLLLFNKLTNGFLRVDCSQFIKFGRLSSYIYAVDQIGYMTIFTYELIEVLRLPSIDAIGSGTTVLFVCNDLSLRSYDGHLTTYDSLDEKPISLHSTLSQIFLGYSTHVVVRENNTVLKEIPFQVPVSSIQFSDFNFLALRDSSVQFYSLLDPFEEEYSSDFEEISPTRPQELPMNLPEEINVVLTFEPRSKLLRCSEHKLVKKTTKNKNDKPVTFHKKIKSSGYGTKKKPTRKPKNLLSPQQEYTIQSYPSVLQTEHLFPKNSPLHKGPIFSVQYSRDATKLLSAGADSVVQVTKLPVAKSRGERIALVGHESSVFKAVFSSDCRFVLSASIDKTAKMWNSSGECMLTIDGQFSDLNFYFIDKFILTSLRNKVFFHKFKLRDPHLKDDVKRLQSKCAFKEVHQISHPDAQSITKFACHNNFNSHIALFAGSNKVVSAFDIDRNTEVRSVQTIHRKPIHSIDFYKGSDYVNPMSESFNTFFTAACDNYIQFHDLRTPEACITLTGHTNTSLELGVGVSPCLQYISSGSEDKSAYIWDIRSANVLERLRGFKEITTDVAWSPLYPQICVSDNEGYVKFFKSQ